MRHTALAIAMASLVGSTAPAADAAEKRAPAAPTFANAPYGSAERQVLDFWKAPSKGPTPLVVHIHGGGWVRGDKRDAEGDLHGIQQFLGAGISVAAINYRYVQMAQEAKVAPPVRWPLLDAARAVQFLRAKAAEWNIDKERIAATGRSAGGCSSLWLAFHADLRQPTSADPVARESTRLSCVAVGIAQTSLDPQLLQEWTPNSKYGGHAFGFWDHRDLQTRDTRFAEFLAHRQELLPSIRDLSPMENVTADDPPVYLLYDSRPKIGKAQGDPTHTANFGVKLQERLAACQVPCELVHPGAEQVRHPTIAAFLLQQLGGAR